MYKDELHGVSRRDHPAPQALGPPRHGGAAALRQPAVRVAQARAQRHLRVHAGGRDCCARSARTSSFSSPWASCSSRASSSSTSSVDPPPAAHPRQMPPEWIRSLFMALAVRLQHHALLRHVPLLPPPAGVGGRGAGGRAPRRRSVGGWRSRPFAGTSCGSACTTRSTARWAPSSRLGMFAYYSGIVFILGAEFTAALRSR